MTPAMSGASPADEQSGTAGGHSGGGQGQKASRLCVINLNHLFMCLLCIITVSNMIPYSCMCWTSADAQQLRLRKA